SYDRHLNLHRAILYRSIRWRSPSQKTVEISFQRFASLSDRHVLAQYCQITPVDFSGTIEVQASINGYPENQGFNHWEGLDQGKLKDGFWLHSRTRNSRLDIGMAARVKIIGTEASLQPNIAPGYPSVSISFVAAEGQTITIEKIITVFTSREVEQPVSAAIEKISHLADYSTLLHSHEQAWREVWDKSDILIEGDSVAAFAVRYNLFQLLIAAPSEDERVSIPAKTLSGFGYRGHIFWDTEIFILPFFTFTQPALARNLLSYRYYTIKGARRKASHYGYQGAMYAWESADTGDDVTPRWSLPNDFYAEDIRIWCCDREIHISADIVYAIWYYWQATNDDEWICQRGAEVILDTAIFWSSRVEYNAQLARYELRGVIGADEYHELVHNNSFTNRLVQWHLEKAIFIDGWLQQNYPDQAAELAQKLHLTDEIRRKWSEIVAKMWMPYDPKTGLIEQFAGFFQLDEINLADYEPRERSLQAILGIEKTNKLQVIKQPDVLMLLYLMRTSQEFPYSQKTLQANWQYYAPRTDITYGSSLAPAIHAILAADLGQNQEAYNWFMQAAMVDLEDKRKNTSEGIHGASAGGVWQAVVLGFGGIQFTEDGPVAHPQLPPNWTRLKFKLQWQSQWHEFDLYQNHRQVPPNFPDLRGVIFDLDGVLTDTAEFHYQAWQKLADEEGLPFNRQINEALRGVSRRASLMIIIGDREYSEAQIQEMMERKNRYYAELIKNISSQDLLPGALDLINDLRQAGVKIAIGSGSKNARTVIERLGIGDKIEAIADGYSVQKPKPAPDLFLYAAQLIRLLPYQCVVFEDATAGIEAGLAGGMWTVGIGPEERVGNAHVILPNLANVTWANLQAKFQSRSERLLASTP
ncbi:MAG TPA: beta-phosphoglucomutase, partial [Nostocaceae cyanobacterium]|nr:beta-phosphoglucomutase [Nostocaceae cyanobacterium]